MSSRFTTLFYCLPIGVLLFTGAPSLAAEKATVKADSTIYTEPSARTGTATRLPAGTAVEISVEIATTEGSWCRVRSTAPQQVFGFLRCAALQRKPKPVSKIAAPEVATSSLATGDEITSLSCDEVNIFSWLRRYQYTTEQMEQANVLAEATGYSECGRRAERFKQAYYPDISMHDKFQLLRDWAKADPGDHCTASLLRFWRAARSLMTTEQSHRMGEDLPRVAALIEQMRGNPAKCIPVFCLY